MLLFSTTLSIVLIVVLTIGGFLLLFRLYLNKKEINPRQAIWLNHKDGQSIRVNKNSLLKYSYLSQLAGELTPRFDIEPKSLLNHVETQIEPADTATEVAKASKQKEIYHFVAKEIGAVRLKIEQLNGDQLVFTDEFQIEIY